MNDWGNSASIRHESAFWSLVALVQSMYGAPVVVLMLDYVRNIVSVWCEEGRERRGEREGGRR